MKWMCASLFGVNCEAEYPDFIYPFAVVAGCAPATRVQISPVCRGFFNASPVDSQTKPASKLSFLAGLIVLTVLRSLQAISERSALFGSVLAWPVICYSGVDAYCYSVDETSLTHFAIR